MTDRDTECHCNPDAVYVPCSGWWCRVCGLFRDDVGADDVCSQCTAVTTDGSVAPTLAPATQSGRVHTDDAVDAFLHVAEVAPERAVLVPTVDTTADAVALDDLAALLRAPEWDSAADYIEAVADIVRSTGRAMDEHPAGHCGGCGLDAASGWCDAVEMAADVASRQDIPTA